MSHLRTVRLVVHPGKHSTSWSLVHRTDDGRTVFDRRLHSGVLSHIGVLQRVTDVSACLRQIADEIDRRHGVPVAEGGSGALEGGGGRPEDTPPPEG
jgi:hypothetical protein